MVTPSTDIQRATDVAERIKTIQAAHAKLSLIEVSTEKLLPIDQTKSNTRLAEANKDFVEVDGKLRAIFDKSRWIIDAGQRCTGWRRTRLPSGDWSPERINVVLDFPVEVFWTFYEGDADEAVRHSLPSDNVETIEATQSQPFHSTAEVYVASRYPQYPLVASWVLRWLSIAPDVQEEAETPTADGSHITLVSGRFGLKVRVDSKTSMIQHVRLQDESLIREWRFEGEIKVQQHDYPLPEKVLRRMWKRSDNIEPTDDTPPWQVERTTSVRVLAVDATTDKVFDWRTYMQFEYNNETGEVRTKTGKFQPQRTEGRKRMTPPSGK